MKEQEFREKLHITRREIARLTQEFKEYNSQFKEYNSPSLKLAYYKQLAEAWSWIDHVDPKDTPYCEKETKKAKELLLDLQQRSKMPLC